MGNTVKIHLANTGNDVVIDAEDFERISALGKWHESDTGYAVIRSD